MVERCGILTVSGGRGKSVPLAGRAVQKAV
ncbi:hypothetical protein M717_12660 [Neisseria gonorrhoeae SK33414]|nr:hypothetical protein M717_12660 [Neisseria gonorrhoeae SK33414]KLR80942.1 hypothetical protein M679_01265 [Neisseria gonorrhoeae SK7842]KLR81397.1 hypothetical protein M680_06455 [Neisseria gonorrhoeae SK8976]KLR93507.1 hypothetical protein M678_10085 [Neisseria gonorrhoeae SK7461]KLR97729.1 hypothetical protein M674_11500 [Neisseria gonorrhoeae SK708]KLS01565.1 hypothetical protein M683_00020 [Neisseria gonorrhoeae SK14515]KLS04503.1 hypothetical protein M686_09440 [Neisseria gonorrhoeae 